MEGKEIFLLISDRRIPESQTISLAFTNQDELNAALSAESFGDLDEENLEVFHGVLISPRYLPESIGGCTPYIMIHNNGVTNNIICKNEVYFIKGPPDVDRLSKVIESFINKSLFSTTSPDRVKLDDIQIFFGHKIPLIFQISEDYLDEELIERVLNLSNKVKELKTIINTEETFNEVNSKD